MKTIIEFVFSRTALTLACFDDDAVMASPELGYEISVRVRVLCVKSGIREDLPLRLRSSVILRLARLPCESCSIPKKHGDGWRIPPHVFHRASTCDRPEVGGRRW